VSVIFDKLKTLAARIRERTNPASPADPKPAGIFDENVKRILRSAEAKNLEHVSALGKLSNWVREAVEEPGLPDEMKKRGNVLLKNLERTL